MDVAAIKAEPVNKFKKFLLALGAVTIKPHAAPPLPEPTPAPAFAPRAVPLPDPAAELER